VKAFAQFDAEAGLKFDQVYEVYSQRFQRDDMEEQFDRRSCRSTTSRTQARERASANRLRRVKACSRIDLAQLNGRRGGALLITPREA